MKMIQFAVVISTLLLPLYARSGEAEREVHLFVTNLVEAYNSRDLATIESLIGDSSQEWLIEEAQRERDNLKMRIVTLSMAKEINVTVEVITSPVTHGSVDSIEMVLTLRRQGKALKLVKTQTPSIELQNREFREASGAAIRFASAVSGGETNAVLFLLGISEKDANQTDASTVFRHRNMKWLNKALAQRREINPKKIIRNGDLLEVAFDVSNEDGTNTVEVVSFERGVFGSGTQRTQVRLKPASQLADPLRPQTYRSDPRNK